MENNKEGQRTKPEIYSRIVGYLRPVQQWNEGKSEEFNDRKEFNPKKSGKETAQNNGQSLKVQA